MLSYVVCSIHSDRVFKSISGHLQSASAVSVCTSSGGLRSSGLVGEEAFALAWTVDWLALPEFSPVFVVETWI